MRVPADDQQWFLRGLAGVHKLNKLMKIMAERSKQLNPASKRITNTSVRKYLCQKLVENNFPDTMAVHVTGHKNPNSLNNYRALNSNQKCAMSTLLSTNGHKVHRILMPVEPLSLQVLLLSLYQVYSQILSLVLV